jgi:membrane associated rhomboid family serine protease
MFLHGGWLPLALHMWSLWIFADNVEEVMGPLRFAAFYLCCGLAPWARTTCSTWTRCPGGGASGAIAGVMGAYFLLYPHAKVATLIPIIIIPYIVELPCGVFLGLWFAGQIFSGLWNLGGGDMLGMAWWAHVGGFAAGMLCAGLPRPGRCEFCWRGERTGAPSPAASHIPGRLFPVNG